VVSRRFWQAYRRAKEILLANAPVLREVAELLIEREQIDGVELQVLISVYLSSSDKLTVGSLGLSGPQCLSARGM
jgi:ATP-dependent Zn protease